MTRARAILHVDLDAFYASVEQRDDPTLRGRPVVVGGHHQRGVVCAASYEARRFGVKSAMPMMQAMKLCPRAVVLPVRMGHYAAVSRAFFAILDGYSPLVEGLSLDEAFLDVTGEERLLGDGPAIARAIKEKVRAELKLVVSVGVSSCKFVAKIASDVGKPDGLLVVAQGDVRSFLAPLPVGRLWGVGEVTERELARVGLKTIGDIARVGVELLASRLGRASAEHLHRLALGEDERAVVPERAPVSVGHEDTFDEDLRDRARLATILLEQADRVCARVRHLGLRARTVTIKVKYANHDLVTRRMTIARATADGRAVGQEAVRLLANVPRIEERGVRLTGVSLSNFHERDAPRQLDLDEEAAERGEVLGDALDRIAARFGDAAVQRADHLDSAASDGKPGRRPPRT